MTYLRWPALWLLASASVISCCCTFMSNATADEKPKLEKLWLYVGTYTGGASKGIYRMELDLASGKLTAPTLAAETASPSFLAIHPNHRFLYSVNEVSRSGGKNTGAITAFAIDPKGDLRELNQQPSGGPGPCHLVVDKQGKHVLAANYGGGSVVVLPIEPDGRLAEASDFVQHHGTSVDHKRQEAPHAHSINLDAANRFAFVADLGLDKVFIYRFDAARGKLTPNELEPAAILEPGSGPRHFAFHPSGRFAYVINEIKSTVTAFAYDAAQGMLKTLQTISTIPSDFTGETSTAEVQVHPSGRFLYGSNRGHDSIAIFTINEQTGELTAVGRQGHHIKTPRNFAIDPTGTYLLVANQDADTIVVFRIDAKTGELTPTGTEVHVPKPVCLKMMPPVS